jgi:multidrug efflux pump subunit AcrA (membrane-fusion protein)
MLSGSKSALAVVSALLLEHVLLLEAGAASAGPPEGGAAERELSPRAAAEEALRANPELRAAREAIEVARGRLVQAGLWPNPEVALAGASDFAFANEGEANANVALEQRFPIAGRLARARDVARAQVELALAEARDFERTLIGDVERAAVSILALDRAIESRDAVIEAGAVFVSEAARRNLDLGLAEAEVRAIEKTLTVIGEIAPVPSRSGAVSSRIAGRVASIAVAEGDSVRKGQPVAEIESLQVGDPPPRVRYAAPIDGIVIDRHVVPGDAVEPNLHLLEIADLSEVLAVGRVFEGQVGRVAVGQAVRVAVPSFPDRSFEGVVERVGGQLDPRTRSLPVYVRVQNPDRALRPNMRAVLSLVVERADAALSVPRGAVLGDFGATFVFVERDGEPTLFERRPVVTGLSDDRWVEILDGVLPGERVVTAGNYSLQFLPPRAAGGGRGGRRGEPTRGRPHDSAPRPGRCPLARRRHRRRDRGHGRLAGPLPRSPDRPAEGLMC